MAEACRLGNYNSARNLTVNDDDKFCLFNVLCVFISLVTILADLTTDILVLAEFCKDGYLFWALATFIFILTPNILINIFSMRWFLTDKNSSPSRWVIHICLVGLLERHILFLHEVFTCKNLESMKTKKLITQRNDLSLLHFLYIFTGTIPQIILQSYGIVILDENYYTKAFALTASIASVVWGFTTYMYSIMAFTSNEKFQWNVLFLKLVWHFGMLIARISSIFLFTIIFGVWTLVPMGLHWSAMTFWIVTQKTTFCPNKVEETLYNVVMGFVYCFCYVNLREGHTRYRLMVFYTFMVTQNFCCLFIYVLVSNFEDQKKLSSIAATTCVMFGTITGICTMILYYRYFHSKGPILWKNNDVELNNKAISQNVENCEKNKELGYARSFKSLRKTEEPKTSNSLTLRVDQPQPEIENADKKFLLEHWIARSGSPTFIHTPVCNNSMEISSIDFHTLENTPQTLNLPLENYNVEGTSKIKRTICSPTELRLKLSSLDNLESSIDEITTSSLNLQKRRGICSSDELRDDLTNINYGNAINGLNKALKADVGSEISHDTDGSNKKTSSDSIDMDLDLSFSDINSSDINTFNENIVQKLCLSALKNIKVGNQDADIENIQKIAVDILKEMYAKKDKSKSGIGKTYIPSKQRDLDTPSEILSVHDYENICAVNIAREAWGLRSWNGYSDIENWLHDGSVVRDRRRDTLTSGSSEISSCLSQELKNAILSAPPFPKKPHTYSNVFVKFDKSSQDDYIDTNICHSSDETFLAKPCIVDMNKDPCHLEPILEELDDLGGIDSSSKKRLNSESSLVATIDEIRKCTSTNSPRNVCHRREQLLNTPPFQTTTTQIDSNLKRALWKEPSKFESSNIMESLPEKENMLNESHGSKFVLNRKDANFSTCSDSFNVCRQPANYNSSRRQKSNNNYQCRNKKINNEGDLSNKDIDLLWHLVSDNSLPLSSAENLSSSSRITSSLQSLIQKDIAQPPLVNPSLLKLSNAKKARSKPRRKFSILRERFEPKVNIHSDEEFLYHCSDSNLHTSDSNIVNVKNHLDAKDVQSKKSPQKQTNANTSLENTRSNNSHELTRGNKEKRTLFMKQVLSPPKFNTKLKYKS